MCLYIGLKDFGCLAQNLIIFFSFFKVPSKGGIWGFPGSLAGKESTCNAGDPGSIPGSGISPGELIGYPVQYSWASLVAQTVKNLPAMQETWVRTLGWEDPLEKRKATLSSTMAWRIPWTEEPYRYMGSQRVGYD